MHRDDGEAYVGRYNSGGYLVHQLLADYQGRANGGNGLLRIMTFDPSKDKIYVKTYSPYTNSYETDADSQFELEYEMNGGGAFAAIGSAGDVASGQQATLVWSSLSPNTTYEWYAKVTDGTNELTGPTWSFTTGP
jgi:hypothetical protein